MSSGNSEPGPGLTSRRTFIATAVVAGAAAGAAGGALLTALSPIAAPTGLPTSASSSRLAAVLERKRLIVGTGTGNPPWHFETSAGAREGFDVEIARILAEGLFGDGDAIEFVTEAPDARIPNLLTDKVDCVVQFMSILANRAQQVQFTRPYYRAGVGLLIPKTGKYQTYDDLKAAGSAVTVAILQNPDAEARVHRGLPDAKVLQIDTPANAYQAALSGRADAVADNDSQVNRYLIKNLPEQFANFVDSGYGWDASPFGVGVKPGDQVWLEFLDTTLLVAMSGDDFHKYATAYKKWFDFDLPTPAVGFPMEFSKAAS